MTPKFLIYIEPLGTCKRIKRQSHRFWTIEGAKFRAAGWTRPSGQSAGPQLLVSWEARLQSASGPQTYPSACNL